MLLLFEYNLLLYCRQRKWR